MNRIKSIGVLILAMAVMSFATACSKPKYNDGVSCESLASAATEQIPEELDFRELEASFRDFYFGEANGFDDCYVAYSAEAEDISEIGVFHSESDEDADEIERACLEYITDLQQNSRAFIESYAPNELTKLDSAEVRRYGRYVVYTVLDGEDAERVFESVRGLLAQ